MSSHQENDTQHFDSLAAEWWDTQGKFKVLHQVNPLRLSFMQKQDSLQGKRILDIGCGGGILSEALVKLGAEVVGLDLSQNTIAVAKQHCAQNNLAIEYHCQSAQDFAAQKPKPFDIICCFEMLEHVDDPADVIQSAKKMLNPQGTFFASTLNRNLLSWLFAVVVAENVLNWIPKGTHNHGKFIQPSELTAMARKAGFYFTHSNGIIWDPLTQSFALSEKRVEINYICRFTNL
jgi:2-polyprenyl-6-hydroxyphenyl methylase/3-demethylubiquinone-9 3-methyltransferase